MEDSVTRGRRRKERNFSLLVGNEEPWVVGEKDGEYPSIVVHKWKDSSQLGKSEDSSRLENERYDDDDFFEMATSEGMAGP